MSSPLVSRILLVLYSLLLTLLLVLAAPWWLWQMARTGKYRQGLTERLGRLPARLNRPPGDPLVTAPAARPPSARNLPPRPPPNLTPFAETPPHPNPADTKLTPAPPNHTAPTLPTIWLHAVSVGEVLAASRLVSDLAPHAHVYISTTTRTGQTLARERFGAHRVFYFPLDLRLAMRAWLGHLRPTLVILVESEFWPRMITECARQRIPVAVVNARISDRSWPRYRRLAPLWRPLLASLSLVLAQSEQDAARLRRLGATTAIAAGNLKYDIQVDTPAPITAQLRARLPAGIPVVVCGSTLSGEEDLLLSALPLAQIVTILAPRHPERFPEVARLLTTRSIPFLRRSALSPADPPIPPGSVVLLDSVGELASLYSLATLAIVGGGFLHPGGHNPLEPAQFAVPILMGAHYANFREVVATLQADHAVTLAASTSLQAELHRLLSNPEALRAMGARARRVFDQHAGATQTALQSLVSLLPPHLDRSAAPPSRSAGDPQPGSSMMADVHDREVPQ